MPYLPVDSEALAKKISKQAFDPLRTPKRLFSVPKERRKEYGNPNPSYHDNLQLLASYAGVPVYTMDESLRPSRRREMRSYWMPLPKYYQNRKSEFSPYVFWI